jgi:hypothetical protein
VSLARKPVVLGTARFKAGAHGGKVKIKLSRSGRTYLAKRKRVQVQIDIQARTGDGQSQHGLTTPVELRAPKRR